MSADQPLLPFGCSAAAAEPTGGPVPVDALLAHVAQLLDAHGLSELTAHGVLSGWRRTRTWGQGELLILDDGDVVARLPVGVPGRIAAAIERRIEQSHPGALAEAPTVVAVGGLEIHPRYGPLRLVARTIIVDDDETRRASDDRARTVAALRELGLFDRQRALRLPDPVTSIRVITGGGTAAGADFRHRLEQRAPEVRVQQLDVPTTGPGAAHAMAGALGRLDRRRLDCIALLRGGGPAIDLTAFDHPDLITAIGRCNTPVLVGVGHATDHTLADRAAQLALPTPSAVADHLAHHNTAAATTSAARARRDAERVAQGAARDLAAERATVAAARVRLRAALVACVVLSVLVLVLVAR